MNSARSQHTSSLLTNGMVLVTGGHIRSDALNSAELYDPSTETWKNIDSMNSTRSEHTASLLMNGKVLVTGGFHNNALNSAELYDPLTELWTITTMIGGFEHNALNSAELYDPVTETWTIIDNMNVARGEHTTSVLTNGKILVAGGSPGGTSLKDVELYSLF
ncbi:unnamed protein product [Rotaria sp. Silwood2]|nr:unnamed protein product [Rotaria sp. Silwood2]